MTKLLSDRIKDLHLRPDAPYPSEAKDAHDLILRWRYSQRLHLVEDDSSDSDSSMDSVDDGEVT